VTMPDPVNVIAGICLAGLVLALFIAMRNDR
jgi:RsiW-degrading membrane proteinase PrsW (M82 family)